MGITNAGLPWPNATDPVANVDQAIKALADAILTSDTPAVTMAAGWTLGRIAARRIGTALVWVELTVTRAAGAATLTASATGNITNNDICTLTSSLYRPATIVQYLAADRGGESGWRAGIYPSSHATPGVVFVSHGAPTATIAAGDTLVIADLYSLA